MVTTHAKKAFITSAPVTHVDRSTVPEHGAKAPTKMGVAIGPQSNLGDHQALNARTGGFDSPLLKSVLEGPLGPELIAFREEGKVVRQPFRARQALVELDRAQLLQLEKALRSASTVNRPQAFAKPIRSKTAQVHRVLSLLTGRSAMQQEPLFPFGHPLHEAVDEVLGNVSRVESELAAWQAGEGEKPDDHKSLYFGVSLSIARGSLHDIANVSPKDQEAGYAELTRLTERISDVSETIEKETPIRKHALQCRQALLDGKYKPDDLRRDLQALEDDTPRRMEFAEVLFGVCRRPAPVLPGSREMSTYAPTDPAIILGLADSAPEGATLYDCGSGLGLVAMMYSFVTGNPAHGVERDPVLCDHSKGAAAELGLEQVSFLEGDARDADYEKADLFFFFNPFSGSVLESVFDKLEEVARKKPIQVAHLAGQIPDKAHEWLSSLPGEQNPSRYQSVSPEAQGKLDTTHEVS